MKKPNFLILFPDQQRYDTINAAGYSHMKTPNLDRLVNEGCVFENAYSPNPVCVPARHYLMTGQSARFHGYYENKDVPILDEGIPTIPQVLSDHGYNTAAIGKMHFFPPRRHHGFDEMHLMEEIPHGLIDDAYAQYLMKEGLGDIRNLHGLRPALYHTPQKAMMPGKNHGANWVADKTVDWLEENSDEPFFLMCGWIKPHPPWNIPDEWKECYDGVDLPHPIEKSREFPFVTENCDWFGDNDSEEVKSEIRKAYYTSVSMVDAAIGRVLDCLERKGVLDNTFIIFASDHGEMLQDKGHYSKELPYESSARIPFVVRYPEIYKKGTRDKKFVDLLQLFPTILDVAGIDYNYKEIHKNYPLAEKSFIKPENRRKYQYCDYGSGSSRWAMVRDERYKYIYYYSGGTEIFYDLKEDSNEIINLVKDGKLPLKDFERLKKVCIGYEKERGPKGLIRDGNFIPYPKEEFQPLMGCGKFPCWANMQFQKFGKETPGKEAKLFVAELKKALDSESNIRESIIKEPQWLDSLYRNFLKLGGNEHDLYKVLGIKQII
jgi:arylsulfatase